jgi:hypothetical protein
MQAVSSSEVDITFWSPVKPAELTFLPEELPVRLAHRIKELNSLPHGLSDMPSIEKVKHWYAQSFDVRVSTTTHLLSQLNVCSMIGDHSSTTTQDRTT